MGEAHERLGDFVPGRLEAGAPRHPFGVEMLLPRNSAQLQRPSIDQEGVGQLVVHATKAGRGARPNLKVGICGEHGGDPESIHFFHRTGLDYVSCSPFRVPIARLAAAQAALADDGDS